MISKLLNLLTKFGLPIIAIGLIAFAVKYMAEAKQRVPVVPPPIEPAANPFANCVAGAGMVEPETENISIGAPLPGIVVAFKQGRDVANSIVSKLRRKLFR